LLWFVKVEACCQLDEQAQAELLDQCKENVAHLPQLMLAQIAEHLTPGGQKMAYTFLQTHLAVETRVESSVDLQVPGGYTVAKCEILGFIQHDKVRCQLLASTIKQLCADGEAGHLPHHRVEWLIASVWKDAVRLYLSQEYTDSASWSERGLDLVSYCGEDGVREGCTRRLQLLVHEARHMASATKQ